MIGIHEQLDRWGVEHDGKIVLVDFSYEKIHLKSPLFNFS